MYKYLFAAFIFALTSIQSVDANVSVGADRTEKYLPLIKGKRVALVINHTSTTGDNSTHILDKLIALDVNIVKVFAPEHGFRGAADAGETVSDHKDIKTGLPIISLYGKNKKPSAEQLEGVDVVIFDIQDVGARFYTYISTMFYVMEQCARFDKEVIVFDRPNPYDYVDGPVLTPALKSFVGIVPIPLLHGLTVGELAQMINGEGWLPVEQKRCKLTVVPCDGWKHGDPYILPIKPSPNLPNNQSIELYASLCLFEATNISVGRGTTFPFQVLGNPDKKFGTFSFTPISLEGFEKNPLHKNIPCYGVDLREEKHPAGFSLRYLISFIHKAGGIDKVVTNRKTFNILAGTEELHTQLASGMSEAEIRKTWASGLEKYKSARKKYLLYPDNRYN